MGVRARHAWIFAAIAAACITLDGAAAAAGASTAHRAGVVTQARRHPAPSTRGNLRRTKRRVVRVAVAVPATRTVYGDLLAP